MDQEEVKSIFDYDAKTGVLKWKVSLGTRGKRENEAGYIQTNSTSGKKYRFVMYKRKLYRVHRIIWLYMTGNFPNNDIDHIDGNGLNNKWENLREVSRRENNRNKGRRSDNTSGITGVSWSSRRNKWHVQIHDSNGTPISGGYFESLLDAAAKRKELEKKYKYHKNHGREIRKEFLIAESKIG